MSRSPRTTRPSSSRLRPRVESLESRRLFTVSPEVSFFLPDPPDEWTYSIAEVSSTGADLSVLSAVSVDPADGSVLTDSPSVISVTFNQPFDPTSVGFDFALYEVPSDGAMPNDLTFMLFEPFDLT